MRRLIILGLLAALPPVATAAQAKPCHAHKHGRCVKRTVARKATPIVIGALAPRREGPVDARALTIPAPVTLQIEVSWTGVQWQAPPTMDAPCESWEDPAIPHHPYAPRTRTPFPCHHAHVQASGQGEHEWTLYQGCKRIFPSVEGALQNYDAWDWNATFRQERGVERLLASPPLPAPNCEGAKVLYNAKTATGSLDLGLGQEKYLNLLYRTHAAKTQKEEEEEEAKVEEVITIWSVGTAHLRFNTRPNIPEGPAPDAAEGPILEVRSGEAAPAFIDLII